MTTPLVPSLPDWAWERADVRQALRARDVGAVFRYVQQYSGASQARIAAAVGMTQARVNEIINRRREVSRLDVHERIADGLNMPDGARHLLGLAASREHPSGGAAFDLAAFPEVVRVYSAQAVAQEEIQQQVRRAKELDVLAVRGLGLIGLKDSMLRAHLRGLRVRVLLLDPEAPVYGMLPTWRLIRADSTLFVGAFDAGWEGHESATYKVMETPHGPLFRGFRRMFDAVARGAQRTV
ncbi:helix-turn-helix domain-containing protein [Streptomyces sp. NPDC085524]|uniref:helix-turn-helix domain-containing protein n=1 Tax=unclassified Streptomyces TaxID=2593676 RepID=UPI0036C5AE08